ncbi:MAG: hypothetical protein QM658_14795 [Gordonia sp. (in: high G+C Gram-positive bacteria)]
MNNVVVVPEAVQAFGSAAAALGTATATAGAVDTAVQSAVMGAAFGLIGQEFLAAFAVAQANHLGSVAQLAGVHAATAVSAGAGLAGFQDADAAGAAGIGRA